VPDYTPVALPGDIVTGTASATITGRQLLEVSGSGTVAPTATLQSQKIVGVAAQDAVSAGRVTYYGRGVIHESVADGTVTAGDLVGSTNTANREIKSIPASAIDAGATYVQATVNAAINAGLQTDRAILGVALITAADNTKVRWMQF